MKQLKAKTQSLTSPRREGNALSYASLVLVPWARSSPSSSPCLQWHRQVTARAAASPERDACQLHPQHIPTATLPAATSAALLALPSGRARPRVSSFLFLVAAALTPSLGRGCSLGSGATRQDRSLKPTFPLPPCKRNVGWITTCQISCRNACAQRLLR